MNGNGQGQAPGKEPVERVIDLFVHTPIGLAVMAWKRVPEFVVTVPDLVGQVVAKGCAQLVEAEVRLSEEVRKARMIGQVAVTFGGRQLRREVDARLRDARQAAGGVASFLPGLGGDTSNGAAGSGRAAESAKVTTTATPSAPKPAPSSEDAGAKPAKAAKAPSKPAGTRKAPAKAAPAKTTAARARAAQAPAAKAPAAKTTRRPAAAASSAPPSTSGPASTVAPASAAELPIREYDGLSASQVVSRLTGLTPDELRAIRAYEEASRARRTVVVAIDRLLG